jgi:hypothetical protein
LMMRIRIRLRLRIRRTRWSLDRKESGIGSWKLGPGSVRTHAGLGPNRKIVTFRQVVKTLRVSGDLEAKKLANACWFQHSDDPGEPRLHHHLPTMRLMRS